MSNNRTAFTIRWLVLFSLLAVSINCQAQVEANLKGKFIYCGPASPVMIDWLCRAIDFLEKHGIKEGYVDPRRGFIPLSHPAPWKRAVATDFEPSDLLPKELNLLGNEQLWETPTDYYQAAKRGIHAHVAMSLCCRRMCDARVFCRGYK